MNIYEITPFSLLDFPGEVACIVWVSSCNLRCVYCHNPDVVLKKGTKTEEDLFDFLNKRTGKLSAVVFSGGEATLASDITDVIRRVKSMGFKVKLDTNGALPDVISSLLSDNLLDSVALDFKAPDYKISSVVGSQINPEFVSNFWQSCDLLIQHSKLNPLFSFEIRTTLSPDILSEEDIASMMSALDEVSYSGTYWLQNIVSFGEKTLGSIAPASRLFDKAKLPKPSKFSLGFRNF
ncbi:MAG: anaerobic ribonucleoside-triphosphate reductase activating protein [Alphaproteobacteria bacterium]|nr:anaerobic ribonucleoside-triphosphate reductase activating protein [Alphaproteobacteria bacterium]MCL2504738.1 anaerobic ribonucleoside-triphosphate reductase activating protein [Alphaproteobacteria bacterium]